MTIKLKFSEREWEREIPAGVCVGDVIATIAGEVGVGDPAHLVLVYNGRPLPSEAILSDFELRSDAVLELRPGTGESSVSNKPEGDPIFENVFAVLRWLRMINHGLFDFEVQQDKERGRVFLIKLKYRGIQWVVMGEQSAPMMTLGHRLQLGITATYPEQAPEFIWQTAIFHPNLRQGNKVAPLQLPWLDRLRQDEKSLNTAGRHLQKSLARFVDMVQFRGNYSYSGARALNTQAVTWIREHGQFLPIGDKDLILTLKCAVCDRDIFYDERLQFCPFCHEPFHSIGCWRTPCPRCGQPTPSPGSGENSGMAERVRLAVLVDTKRADLRLQTSVSLDEIRSRLLNELNVVEDPAVVRYRWCLRTSAGDQEVDGAQSIGSQGITEGSTIILTSERG